MKFKDRKILMITNNGIEDRPFGGPKGSIRNYKALCELGTVDVYTISKKSTIKSIMSFLTLQYPPTSLSDLKNISRMIEDNNYSFIFFDGSLYGTIIKIAKKKYHKKIVVFFHNVEIDYISVRFGKRLIKWPYFFMAKFSEKLAAHYSDLRIAFSKRDSNRIMQIYKTNVDGIVPLTIEDRFELYDTNDDWENQKPKCLFFGPYSKPNYEAAHWFVTNVSEKINAFTIIAGKGFEDKKAELTTNNVEVIGSVDDLVTLYQNVDCVVLPIFSGAGMKVKTCEALMFGKTIFGTNEAFEGYELDFDKVGGLCNSADEFIDKINYALATKKLKKTNEYSRDVFLKKYSYNASSDIFKKIFETFLENEIESKED